jgi:hypothetical protein
VPTASSIVGKCGRWRTESAPFVPPGAGANVGASPPACVTGWPSPSCGVVPRRRMGANAGMPARCWDACAWAWDSSVAAVGVFSDNAMLSSSVKAGESLGRIRDDRLDGGAE